MNRKLHTVLLIGIYILVNNSVKAQVNDLPCNATFLPLGIYLSGNNTGATSTSEPASAPSCFGAGARNTVWYKFIAPATGCVKIKTVSGSLTDTQIALFSGTCGALGAELVCNNDATGCAGTVYPHSQMQWCGLSSGVTYFIVVDGRGNNTGTFSISVLDGGIGNGTPYPPAPIQDCALPQLICGTSISYPDPGFQGVGNICDHPATNCLGTGERGSAWFRLVCNGTGNIAFTIVPNNHTTGATGTDYDFGVWRIGGPTGPNYNCSTLSGNMLRCNYDPIGVTGCYMGGSAPPGYGGSGAAFEAQIPVLAGDILLIEISNYAISTTGFSATFTGPIATATSPGGTLVWTGTVSTDWFNVNNWGGCALPTCQTNVIIPNFTTFQPLITGQDASCRNIDINLGATVTLDPNRQLMVCNDFLNNGSFVAGNSSLALFTDTCTVCPPVCVACAAGTNHNQTIAGNLTGADRFWHVTATKPAGLIVQALQDIDMAGDFTVTGGPGYGGTFDASGIYHKVAGNIDVQNVVAPFGIYNYAATLEHNGTAAATYRNAGFISNMTMNHTGTGLTLLTSMQMLPSGTLTLNSGKIITNNFMVVVNNRSLNAITAGNVNSYVENLSPAPANSGLRKYLYNLGGAGSVGQYEFPVGTSAKGYQRMSWTISSAWPNYVSMNYLTVNFNNNWPTAGGSNNTLGPECAAPNYHTGGAFALDNGVWEARPNATSTFNIAGCLMDVTLYNRSYTNASLGYTVQYNKVNGTITTAANWQLNPFPTGCFGNPPITAVIRRGINAQTVLASTTMTYFNTAQTIQPLPVELLNFEARGLKNSILVKWVTASEMNNLGFELERTTTPPNEFENIAWIDGHGSTSNVNYYTFNDENVKPGIIYYYRLKQIDFNGNLEYSKIVSGSIGGDITGFAFNVMPNPYSGNTSITYTLKENAKVKIEVLNVMGQQVSDLYNDNQTPGDYHYEFSAKAAGYAQGIYTVRVFINEQLFTKRILETD